MNFEVCGFLRVTLGAITPEWISACAAVDSTIGIWFVRKQLVIPKDIAQLQFEDVLEKEYRELVSGIPTKALLDSVSQPAFKKAWRAVKIRTEDHASEFFSELRRLERFAYDSDPKVDKA